MNPLIRRGSNEPDGFVGLVNPLQGSDSTYERSHGNTLPLVSRAWAMTAWSLETSPDPWFFHPRAPKVRGIRATRQPSPWVGDYGNFTLLPQTGPLIVDAAARASSYRVDELVVKPHYLKVDLLRYRTRVECTSTERCGFFRFTFTDVSTGRLILELGPGEGQISVDLVRGSLVGYTQSNSGGVPKGFASHFVIQLDRPVVGGGIIKGGAVLAGVHEHTGNDLIAFVDVDLGPGSKLEARAGTSFIGPEQAVVNLGRELGSRPFDEIRNEGRDEWNALLGRITLDGATEEEERIFYSCLYRALLFPHKFHEADAQGSVHHYSPYTGDVRDGVLYTDNGFWDTHRTVYPLYALLYRKQLAEILEGWVQAYRESGWLPRWPSPGHREGMISTHIDAVIADAAVKGVEGFDLATAYEGMRKHATVEPDVPGVGRADLDSYIVHGYVPHGSGKHSVSETLDHAYNDWCIGQVADILGLHEEAAQFRRRSLNHRNLYDRSVGFMRARQRDGSWVEGFDPISWGGPYVEGSAWQCSWSVPHDIDGLIDLFGGRDLFVRKLDALLSSAPVFEVGAYGREIHEMTEMAQVDFGQYAHSNQPSHHVLYLFAIAGEPWKTQYWTRRVLADLYGAGPDGFCGDEDTGEMSAWYILSALGLFPACPGDPSYIITSPLHERATLYLESGQSFSIVAMRSHPDDVYITGSFLNGHRHEDIGIQCSVILDGGELIHTMAPANPDEVHH